MQNRILGTLYGQLIGDALGSRYEFDKSANVTNRIANDIRNQRMGYLPILGGGPFKLVAGQVTDDSELALGLLTSLAENKGYLKERVAEKYIKWFHSNPFDIGNATRNAFQGASNYNNIIKNSRDNYHSLSNGCLMRISPLAIYGTKISNNLLLQYCKEDCSMTNPNPIAIDAVSVYVIAIKVAILSGDVNKIYHAALSTAKTNLIKNILLDAKYRPDPVLLSNDTKVKTDSQNIGYLGIALQNTFYELLNGKSFYQSLINIISRGGDTDTNGCIAGALLGAFYGVNEIPPYWIETVIKINNPRVRFYPEVDQKKDVLLYKLKSISG